jgi:hypothetical protein
MQETVLEREELLQQSRWSIARSKRLVARFDQLKEEVFGAANHRVEIDRKRLRDAFPGMDRLIRR